MEPKGREGRQRKKPEWMNDYIDGNEIDNDEANLIITDMALMTFNEEDIHNGKKNGKKQWIRS